MSDRPEPASIARSLLRWYDRHRRTLPWRVAPGEAADPYRVWLSEIMLQQTTVATVGPYYRRFTERWPDVTALADADLQDVLTEWAGLGYYARARNLKKCAEAVTREHGAQFPSTEARLRELPGIGAYTAAAIAAIAFGRKANVVDGNVERVVARLFAVEQPMPKAKARLRDHAAGLLPEQRCGDYAQALMDLGATICTPRQPNCLICPLRRKCLASARGIAAELPRRAPKAVRPVRHGVAFWLTRRDGAALFRKRADTGLLGGMTEVPSTPWRAEPWSAKTAAAHAPAKVGWRELPGAVEHTFTHFHLVLKVFVGKLAASEDGKLDGDWHVPEAKRLPLPTVMKKIVRHASAEAGGRKK